MRIVAIVQRRAPWRRIHAQAPEDRDDFQFVQDGRYAQLPAVVPDADFGIGVEFAQCAGELPFALGERLRVVHGDHRRGSLQVGCSG